MAVLFTNNASGRLAGSISTLQTTLSLQSGQGARFPNPSGGDWFPLTVIRANGDMEIMRCTGRSNDLLTVTRAQESTPGREFEAGDRAELRITSGALAQIKIDAFPSGGIIMWSGAIGSLPEGWALCDGANGTPDLRNRFVVGAGSTYSVGATGGADSVTLTAAQMPTHNHSASTATAGAHTHGGSTGNGGGHSHTGTTASNGSHGHTASTGSAGAHTHTASSNSAGAHTHAQQVNTAGQTNGSNRRWDLGTSSNLSLLSTSTTTASAGGHSHTITVNSNGAHTHTVSVTAGGDHTHTFSTSAAADHNHSISSDGGHTHTMTVGNAGSGQSHENRPPYYALAYIMKL